MDRFHRPLDRERLIGRCPSLFASTICMAMAAAALATAQIAPAGESSPFMKWLNEDVAYIIDDQERDAFQRLTSDEEREKFIQQFWQRRDPSPGTARNEAKEEHYRRIAYTNERFSGTSRAGWATDRGRTYIQWGPPDEIESHPSGTGEMPPFETWRYRHLEGIGSNLSITFIDRTRKGDYQVAPAPAR